MPRVPVYDDPQAQVQSVQPPVQSHWIMPRESGDAANQQQQLGGEIQKGAAVVQNIADTASAKERLNAYQQTMEFSLHNSDPSQPGYLNKIGGDAVKGRDDAIQSIPKPQDFTEGLTGPAAEAFTNVAQQQYGAAMQAIDQHAAQQTHVYNAGQSKALALTQDGTIASNWAGGVPGAAQSNPVQYAAYQNALHTKLNAVEDYQTATGQNSPAEMALAKSEALSSAHVTAVEGILAQNNPAGANAYFQANKGEIDTKSRAQLNTMLQTAGTKDASLRLSQSLTGTPEEQTQRVDKMFADGRIGADLHDATVSRIEHNNAVQKQQDEQNAKTALGDAQDFFLHNPGSSVLDLPTNTYTALKANGNLAAAEAFVKGDVPSDPKVVSNISNHFRDGSALDISNRNAVPDSEWFNFRSKLSPQDFSYWDKQRSNQLNGTHSTTDPGNVSTPLLRDALNSRLSTIGVPQVNAKSSDADKALAGARWQYVQQYVLDAQKATGHSFNKDEINATMNELFAKDVAFRQSHLFGLWNSDEDQKMMSMTQVPEPARSGIVQALQSAGNKNPTDSEVMLQYWRINGGRP